MTVSMPKEAFTEDAHIQWNHVDGPLLTWAGQLHWLTWRERLSIWLKKDTANSIAAKRWNRFPTRLIGWFLPYSRLNEPMQEGFETLHRAATRARYTNAITRRDGVETVHEADWIKKMVKVGLPEPTEPPKFAFNHSEYGFSGSIVGPSTLIAVLGDAVKKMSEDGWLYHGPEGMSEAQTAVFKAYELHEAYLAERETQEAAWRAAQSATSEITTIEVLGSEPEPEPPMRQELRVVLDIDLPPPPDIDTSNQIGYDAIRYVSGYTESYAKDYAKRYAKQVLVQLGYTVEQS